MMERLWRPWRMQYIRMAQENGEGECIFCTKPAEDDDRSNLIIHRGERCFIIMNLFPYNTGHLMVSPYRHVGEIEELDREEQGELMLLTVLAVKCVKEAMQPQGFNLGMNLGKVSGAGFDQHLHMHVVPRWQGDTNFMPVVAGAKVMPESLQESYDRLRKVLQSLIGEKE